MKKLIAIFLVFIQLSLFGRWTEVTTPTSENLNGIEIVNGIAYCIGNNGEILKSVDQGDSWTPLNSGTSSNLTCIVFINSNLGFIGTADGMVLKTTNGGSTWSSASLQSVGGINGLDFTNENTGIAVGDNGNVFHTTNGGSTWNNLGSQSIFVLNDVTFINDTMAVAVGANGSIIASLDEGATWFQKNLSVTNTFSSITKTDSATASFVGTGGVYGTFSANSFSASNPTQIDQEGDWLKDIHYESISKRIFAVGTASSINLTNPGWKQWDLDSVNNVNSIHFFDDTIGIACGLNGKIYKTLTAGMPVNSAKITQSKLNIFPNPAHEFINLPNQLFGEQVQIYNAQGKLILQQKVSGPLNISSLSSQIYFLKITSNNHVYSGRLIKK